MEKPPDIKFAKRLNSKSRNTDQLAGGILENI